MIKGIDKDKLYLYAKKNDVNIGIDVDGTLTKEIVGRDILERSHSEVEKAMLNCSPKDGIDILLEDKIDDYNIYVITGREERFYEATSDWLNMYGIPHKELIMFPKYFYAVNGWGTAKYVDLKLEIHIRKDIYLALDDKDEVISAFNKSGISACKVDKNFKEAFEKLLLKKG